MAVLVICLFLAPAAGLIATYARLSPLQAVQDERTARQEAQEGRGKAVVTEGEELLKGVRSLIKELTLTVHLERVIANERRDLDTAHSRPDPSAGSLARLVRATS